MRGIVVLVLGLALPSAVLAQDARLERIRQAFPAEAVSRIEGILAESEAAGVPTGPLYAKALEGVAKGVPADRVVAALNAYAEHLQNALSLVGAGHGAAAVVAGADALRRGVPVEAVRSLASQYSGDLAVPLVVMGDLIETGVPADGAYEVVQDALQKQQTPEEMLAIPGAVRQLMREGSGAGEAANAVGRAINRGQFGGQIQQGKPGAAPPKGPPVPPGAGPPDHAGPKKDKRKGNTSG
ncbi:MAG: hypothetical protein JSU87_03035 [Gemmatimonadota bacterium]|nr:MAG: hypothetical protein JSU87_03035 [Gemmatimonadota bacterium]